MATFSGQLDLMALIGAKLLEGIDSDAPKRGYICIPLDWNQIKVNVDKRGSTHANMDIYMGPASEGIVKWWEKNRIQAGEPITVYNIPSHRISLSLTQEYREQLADRAKALYFAQHSELNPDTLTEQQKQELKAFVGMKSNITLCTSMWMHEPKGQLLVLQHLKLRQQLLRLGNHLRNLMLMVILCRHRATTRTTFHSKIYHNFRL